MRMVLVIKGSGDFDYTEVQIFYPKIFFYFPICEENICANIHLAIERAVGLNEVLWWWKKKR